MTATPTETPCLIYRYYFEEGRKRKLIKRVPTIELAQLHCSDPKTRKEGEWFDGYTQQI